MNLYWDGVKLDLRESAHSIYDKVRSCPGKYYFEYDNTQFFPKSCYVAELTRTDLKPNTPYLYGGCVAFATDDGLFVVATFDMCGEPCDGNGWAKSNDINAQRIL